MKSLLKMYVWHLLSQVKLVGPRQYEGCGKSQFTKTQNAFLIKCKRPVKKNHISPSKKQKCPIVSIVRLNFNLSSFASCKSTSYRISPTIRDIFDLLIKACW